jgi:hypothetical protein
MKCGIFLALVIGTQAASADRDVPAHSVTRAHLTLASAKTVSLTPRFNAGKRMLIVTLQLFSTVFPAPGGASECSQAFTAETV